MKKILILSTLTIFFSLLNAQGYAQKKSSENQPSYGKNFNLGIGLGYYGYIGSSLPVLMCNYEFDMANNITLAPFVGFYSYSSNYYLGSSNYSYSFRETVIPLGVKGFYYFDKLLDREGILDINNEWDFYGAASLGFAVRSISWDAAYTGDKTAVRGASPLYLDVHIGSRYHINDKISVFLDLSTGVSLSLIHI